MKHHVSYRPNLVATSTHPHKLRHISTRDIGTTSHLDIFDTTKSKMQTINHPALSKVTTKLVVKRDDLIHHEVSGNKWRKLQYNILHQVLSSSSYRGILTFGGGYSNHLLATASACNSFNIPSIGIVRGEELHAQSNPLLSRCQELGMALHFVSRQEYLLRDDLLYIESIQQRNPHFYIIPEGGKNALGVLGCAPIIHETCESLKHLTQDDDNGNDDPFFHHFFLAQGTTTTSTGCLLGMIGSTSLMTSSTKGIPSSSPCQPPQHRSPTLHVVPVVNSLPSIQLMTAQLAEIATNPPQALPTLDHITQEVYGHAMTHLTANHQNLLGLVSQYTQVHLPLERYGAKYGRATPQLLSFMEFAQKELDLPLDRVYTAKAFAVCWERIMSGAFSGQSVVFLHTGGLGSHSSFH